MRYTYTESVIHREMNQNAQKLKMVYLILAAASLILALLVNSIFLLGVLLFGIAYYKAYQNSDVEYEYVHTNNVFDIDKVIQNSSRKQVLSIHLDQVAVVAPVDSATAERYGNLKEEDFSDGVSKDQMYMMICTVSGKQRKLRLQLEPAMLRSLQQWIPEKIQLS